MFIFKAMAPRKPLIPALTVNNFANSGELGKLSVVSIRRGHCTLSKAAQFREKKSTAESVPQCSWHRRGASFFLGLCRRFTAIS
jgi:hypothetical protein